MSIIKKFSDYDKTVKSSKHKLPKDEATAINTDDVFDNDIKMNKNILSQEKPDKDIIGDNVEKPKNDTHKKTIPMDNDNVNSKTNETVKVYGKIAKFPKNTKAEAAYSYLKNLKNPKLSKNDIWYIMLEKQGFDNNGNELQMIKYDQKKGVNLTKFIIDLKSYYMDKYSDNKGIVEAISKIELCGDKDGLVSSIKNIPDMKIEDGKKLSTKITSDLINLLHK